ncbi:MAG TPA: RNA polymerase sigma factor RpoD/SigA [Candidatus Paceibacterota bacterium]|nr:RNA polymerase sigma factor RpoD/SigA [Candidatus Paceibacterota bacterium]
MKQLKIVKSITNRSDLSVEKYLYDISKIPLITSEREIELAKLIKNGDKNALNELVNSNLRFVVSVAKQYQNRGVDFKDLINDGNLGLIKAAERFDETRGFKFISFAVWWVRQSILDSIANNGRLIRVPLNKIGLQNKFLKVVSVLEQELQRPPSDEEIMEKMELEAKELNALTAAMGRVQSYDVPISSSDGTLTVMDVLISDDNIENSPDISLMNESIKSDINRILETLHPREKNIVESFFGLNGKPTMSLIEIAELYEYSPERVRQIKETALRRFRVLNKAKLLKKYLN